MRVLAGTARGYSMYFSTARGVRKRMLSPRATRSRISVLVSSIIGIVTWWLRNRSSRFGRDDPLERFVAGLGRPGATHDHGNRQFADAAGLTPLRQVRQRVGAHQQEQFGIGVLGVDLRASVSTV